jgi:hypothetical protein
MSTMPLHEALESRFVIAYTLIVLLILNINKAIVHSLHLKRDAIQMLAFGDLLVIDTAGSSLDFNIESL